MHMWYCVVIKVGCRYSVYNIYRKSGSNYSFATQIFAESSDCCFDQYIL